MYRINKRKTIPAAAAFLACFFLLNGCQEDISETQPTTETQVIAYYTVTYEVADGISEKMVIKEGDRSAPQTAAAPEGWEISGWTDSQGNPVYPDTVSVYDDLVFTAVLIPDFSYNHAPYMTLDENGFFRPDAVLTGSELIYALEALAPDEKALELLSLPDKDESVTKQLLEQTLCGFFSPTMIINVFRNTQDGPVTRVEFADIINTLLDRYDTETIIIDGTIQLPRDIDLSRHYADDILEAVMEHTPSDSGSQWIDAVLTGKWEPGYHVLGGHLYYANAEGNLLRDESLGTLYFDESGRYTRHPDLDPLIAELLEQFILESPQASREELLYRAFEYCRDELIYVGRGILDFGATGWEAEWALQALQTGASNCYGFNAAFCELARGLGYDAYCVSGLVLELSMPHAWCEFEIDGTLYIFDPQLAYRELTGERTNWGEDMFQIPMHVAWSWRYIWP